MSPEEQSPLLNALSFDDLKNYADPNSQLARVQKFKFATVQNSLRGIIKAFLSPTRLKQHLYIIGGSERIAMLIWGLTHSIPETLLPGLTFTTYEHDPDKSNETIVGTITSDALVIPDRAKIRITITPSYSSYTNTTVDEYVSFAVDCLIQHGNGHSPQLNALVKQAEEKNITTVEEFMELFQQFTAKKDPSQLIRDLINALLRSDWSQVARICNEFTALFPPEDSEAVWSSLFQSLSEEPLICEHILQDWNTYTWLFSGLAATIALPNADTLDLWLSGSWDNLRMLLSLDVPENWRREAVALTLLSPKQSRSNMVEVVQEHKQLVTDVLQQFVIEPEEELCLTSCMPGNPIKIGRKNTCVQFLSIPAGYTPKPRGD